MRYTQPKVLIASNAVTVTKGVKLNNISDNNVTHTTAAYEADE